MNETITSAGRVIEVFHEAKSRAAGAEREQFLTEACGDDAPLREEVNQLLAADEDAADFLNDGNGGADFAGFTSEQPGERIGRYKLLQQIGEGGFGTVWMAEQLEPVTRRVALKIIKAGMDTREVIARFEAERQALAMMDHPNIAKVFDAGATDKGRPFFVMELVKGTPITRYCDEAQLGTRQRLALFEDVCSAINHAHQKGIIHRDIKPSNVMVTMHGDKPVVKVIDFGIAKATQGKLTDKTLFTRFEQFIGTPVYMSPEQTATSGLDIDTRSDIYALGILLYELLTGKPPFDAKSLAAAGYEEMRRIIREVEPPKPSSRLSTVAGEERTTLAKARHIEPEKLSRLVEPDLDWIVMKAIDKDRTRRYETANGLALDIQRFLSDEPVSATPPSAGYKFRKFARRNKAALRVAAAIAALLVAATLVSSLLAVRAAAERDAKESARRAAAEAEQLAKTRLAQVAAERDAKDLARKDAEAIATFLTEVFESPDPERDGRNIKVVELLDTAGKKLESELAGQPAQRARLQSVLGNTWHALGLYREAVALKEKALEYHRANSGASHAATRDAMGDLSISLVYAGRLDEALKLSEELVELMRDYTGHGRDGTNPKLNVMTNLANCYQEAGRMDEALKLYEFILRGAREQFGEGHLETVPKMHNLAYCYAHVGRGVEALQLQEEVLVLRRKLQGPEHPETLGAMHNLAMFYAQAGRGPEALALNGEVLSLRRKVIGPEHPDTLQTMTNLAADYGDAGRQNEALELQEEVVALHRKVSSPENPQALMAMLNLGVAYRRAERLPEALALMEPALITMRRVLPRTHPWLATALQNLAELYELTGREADATALREALAGLPRKPPQENPQQPPASTPQ
jgi:serine/threonine protein kinase